MFARTSIEAKSAQGQKPCVGGVVCAGMVGVNQAAGHAIANPRDPGGPGFM